MFILDGSYGEGGGQILRSSLTLAALTGRPCRVENIRAGRPQPGLRPQHLTAVRALAQITRGEVDGAEIGSTRLTFRPQGIYPGEYRFDVAEKTGSAGSVCLIAQTLVPVLAFGARPSQIVLKGGTHVPWSPPAHYFSLVFLPVLAAMGVTVTCELPRWGFYPQGGGEIRLTLQPVTAPLRACRLQPPNQSAFRGLAAVANLPASVNERQVQTLRQHLPWLMEVEMISAPAPGRGTFVFLWGPQAGFSALGAKGKPAEAVATEAATALTSFLASGTSVDKHLADQLILYAALAAGETQFTTETVTNHLLTNIWVVEQFLPVKFQCRGTLGEPGLVQVQGIAWSPA